MMNRYGKQFRCGIIIVLCISLLTGTGCSAWQGMSKTGQGATIGAGSGAAAGAGIGALVGGGKGAWIGSLIGAAVGSGTGALIGRKMDKQQQELEAQLKMHRSRK